MSPPKNTRPIWMHPFAATGYSAAGARFLMRQRAAQIQVVMGGVTALLFVVAGVGAAQWAMMIALFIAGLAIEALNTAIELIVDRLSPEISDFAKHAKDLGSFAVGCVLLIFAGHAIWALMQAWG
ncbi:diacylglycerol kinase [Jannaschia sp. 2305UL9-9]|uniref:diacylglycerol kinase n=1 Tax=Jannaschia sp. 2305UL9-9 TaxID=3121638 RepID=UPI003528F85D